MSGPQPNEFDHDHAELDDVSLHYAHSGSGALIVFIHGFPQCWYMWRYQLAEFGRDHLAVAPDLRGYNLSSKPEAIEEYGPWRAARDIRALAAKLGHQRFVLVGHDWGAATAWSFALHYPELLEALVILATPHPATFDRALHESLEQKKASQYLLGLRRPEMEDFAEADAIAALKATLAQPFLDEEDLAVYRDAWRQPNALAGMLCWYQREGLGPPEDGTPARGNYAPEVTPLTVRVPTLVIYPDADIYTRPPAHEGLDRYVPDLTYRVVNGGSHWVAEESPELVNQEIRHFLEATEKCRSQAKTATHPASQGSPPSP
jgi:pimeloyl-ACP methyl ester carboxylesterase